MPSDPRPSDPAPSAPVGPTGSVEPPERAEVDVDVDVVVVGAGIAGLAVARALVGRGVRVMVIEGRDRVGGRLRSETVGGGERPLDLGATWFWPGEHRVARLVDELGLATHEQHLQGDALYEDDAGVRRLDGNPIDVTSRRFTAGAQALAEAIAQALPASVLCLGSSVRRLVDVGRLRVEHDRGAVDAAQVVLAVPPALAVGRIEFSPPLPDRLAGLAAVTPVWMGATTKAVAVYDHPFWRDVGLSGSAISHVGPLRELHDMSGPGGSPAALFGFAPAVPGRSALTEVDVARHLGGLFGARAAHPLEVIVADWRREPFTSPSGVERLTAYQAFGHELYQAPALGGRLHWASTETATVAPGHIEGALAAAERVVAAIAADPVPSLRSTGVES